MVNESSSDSEILSPKIESKLNDQYEDQDDDYDLLPTDVTLL